MAGSTYTQRDTNSGLANTGGDTEVNEFIKIITAATETAVNVTISIDAVTTERCKWITETNKPQTLNWDGGTYTWRWNVVTPNVQLQIIEVILRRLSADGNTVRASVTSGNLLLQTLDQDRTGTITWNDGTQNPTSRQVGDRLEIVFRIQNLNAVASSGSVECNVSPDDTLSTPIILKRTPTETVPRSEILDRNVCRIGPGAIHRSINEVVSYGENLTRRSFFFRGMLDPVFGSDSVNRNKISIIQIIQSVIINDSVIRILIKNAIISQIITLNDLLNIKGMKKRSIVNPVFVIDSVSNALFRKISETGSKIKSIGSFTIKMKIPEKGIARQLWDRINDGFMG